MSAPPRFRSAWLTGFILGNALLASLIACSNIPLSSAGDWRSLLFLLLALPGHFIFFGGLVALPAWAVGRLVRDPRWMIATAVTLQTFWICLLLADAKVFALYRFHLNAMVANMIFGGALNDQVTFSAGMWALIALAVVALAALEFISARLWWRALDHRPGMLSVRSAWWGVGLWLVLGQAMAAYSDARGDRAVLSQLSYIPWAQPITLKGTLERMGVETVETPTLPDASHSHLGYPLHPLRCDAQPTMNVLVVLVESLRHEMLDPAVMPNTWRYAQGSEVFRNHYSTGNATRFGLFGLMYGLPGGYWQAMLAEQRGSAMIEAMQQDGYRMHIYGSAPLYSPEFDRTVFSQVRDRIVNAPSDLDRAQRDRYVVERIEADIRNHPAGERFFGFVFLDSPHAPYHLPAGFQSPFQPMAKDVNFLKLGPDHDPTPEFNRYRAAVHYSDQMIGQLLQTLQDSPLADNTVVLITGDHGEEFNDLHQNYWGHNGNFSDYQLRTPFVLHWPGRAPRTVDAVTSHEDFVPTVMRHALNCSNDTADYATGVDLFGLIPNQRPLVVESWSQRAIREGERIYLFDNFGPSDVVDRQYRPIVGADVPSQVVGQSWAQLTRFQKR
ncbi:sulfatase-like hydrolase/transferase [Lysobacter sp. LF1]|uniref:Sulfatase-like hydrolase/transferase n=1 Tax=Lysobacter stagni TaxID=3045172 RepID=A0ABT6XJV1_9GAMM|nr:sulfatase-like hydrolase/transferase [Lysobacter sp. LF1]MDI9240301.1 sulfatase-like hydrolase/transferase [Lysobacter sp. LF1]